MAAPCQPCSTGLTQCHLRRIGSQASISGVADVIHFWKTVTLIGRKKDVVDYFLSYATPRGSDYMSRIHARVIRMHSYELVDSSLSGVYVNDVRICGRVVLQEGDTVTFGHPASRSVPRGARARQPNSPFYFLFEHCHCSVDQMQSLQGQCPVLAAARASQGVSPSLAMKVALLQRAGAASEALPACPALPEQNAHCCRPALFSSLTVPLTSAASVQPPFMASPATGSVPLASRLLERPDVPRPCASPDSAEKESVQFSSGILRSVSPEYAVLEEEMPVPTTPPSQGAPETTCSSFQAEERGSPDSRLSLPSTKQLGLRGSEHGQEITMEIHPSTEETAKCDTSCISDPGAQVQVLEPMEEAVSGGQVAAAGCSEDRRLEGGTVEGHGELFAEKLPPEAVLEEAEWAAEGSITDNSFANQTDILDTEMLELLSSSSGSRTPNDLLCGQELGRVSPSKKMGFEVPSMAFPCEIQSGGDSCEEDSQGSASEGEGGVEMLPPVSARLLAMKCCSGARNGGSAEPEEERGIADDTSGSQVCYAEVGTQTGDIKEGEMGPAMAEPGGEGAASRTLAVSQHEGSMLNTRAAEETLLQQLPNAFASNFPTREVSSKEELPREKITIAVAPFAVMQENWSSENLPETCKEDAMLAAPAFHVSLAWEKGLVLEELPEADLLEQPMDLHGKHLVASPSQRNETFSEGMWDERGRGGVVAERELECGSARRAETNCAAEGQQPRACWLGWEGERPEEESAALRPAGASLTASPGGGEPGAQGGCETQGQEGMDHAGTAGEGEPEAHRAGHMAAALPSGAAVGKGSPEDQPERLLGQPSAALQASCGSADSHRGEAAGSSSVSAPGPTRWLPTVWLSGTTVEAKEIHCSEQNDTQAASPSPCYESNGLSSGHSTHLGCQEESPLPQDSQEPELPAGEPWGLGKSPELKRPGAGAEDGSLSPADLPLESSAWEEACGTDTAVKCLTPPRPAGCSDEATVPEEGDGWEQSLKSSLCREEKSNLSLGLCAAGSEMSSALRGSIARHLPRESPVVSGVGPESSSIDEFNLHLSDSEAKREEDDNSRLHSASGRQAVVLKERDALISGSVEHLAGVTENGEACGKVTEQDPCEAVHLEAGGVPAKAADALEEQNSSPYEHCCDPSSAIADIATSEESPSLGKAAAVDEELEGEAVEGTALVPSLNPSCASGKDLCLLESDAKLGTKEQVPGSIFGLAEEVGLELLEDHGLLDSRSARQPGGETLEVGGTPEKHLQSEMLTSVCAGKVDSAQQTGRKALLHLKQEMETLQPPENVCQPEVGPGCSGRLENSEYGRSPFLKEEEPEGFSSRKRHFREDQVLRLLGAEHDSCGPKRPCLLESGSDLQAFANLLTAHLDSERHQEQCGRAIEGFVRQYSNLITLHSDKKEEENTDIAQILRSFFNRKSGLAEPVGENLEAEMSAVPREAGMSEETDCKSAARSEVERRPAGEERDSSLRLNAEPQVNRVKSWNSSLSGQRSPASAVSHSFDSHTQQPGQESVSHVPESVWKAYLSEEEECQPTVSSVLNHSPLNAPVSSPERQCKQEPCAKFMDLLFSDNSSSSTETEQCEFPPKPECRSSSGMGSRQLHGMLSEAAEVNCPSGGACGSPEPSDRVWCQEDRSAPFGLHTSPCESILTPKEEVLVEPGNHLGAVAENTNAPVLQQAGGMFDGEDGRKTLNADASKWVTSCTSYPVGETRQELDESASKMQIEDVAFLQKSHEDPPSPELECKPSTHQPSDSTLWNHDVKAEFVRCEEELSSEDGNASPSTTADVVFAPESVGCPTVANIQDKESVRQNSLLSYVAPCPEQAQARDSLCRPNGSCSLRSMKREGCAKAVDAGAHRTHQSREDGSFVCPLPLRGPAGMADNPEGKGFREGLESDLGRNGARWTGQTDTSSAARGHAGGTKSAGAVLTVGLCGNQRPAGSLLVQEDAPAMIQLTDLPSVSCVFKEEVVGPCDPQVQSAAISPCGPCPTACSPVFPILQKPRMAKASTDWVPESPGRPVEFHDKDKWLLPYQLDEAEVSKQPDAACMQSGDQHPMCVEAKEGNSSTPTFSPRASDAPPQGNPCHYDDGSAQNISPTSVDGADSHPGKNWASSEQEIAFQLQECQSVLEEISQSLCAVEGIGDMHMDKWREQISELQKATKMPSTYIAVVGNTGAGKSSLLNALLDEEAVLPTSAMRACTAVVVEISRAAGGRQYEADVEFLSQEEWYKELEALLEDMKDKSGNLKKRCPDRKTEAGAAYSRVKAVYGRVDEVAKLEGLQEVTRHLGTVKHVSAATAAEFRTNIEKYIDSRTDNLRDMKGGEYWPVVKCVKIRVAQAEVLKTGVVLVDLPGIRDSNAARDNAAKEYLKNCNAVWVVASITRAVDDKTAKEILNSNLRRQLFMDGQYGNLAFICTKTDSFNITDIVRDLDLRDEIQPLEEELEELEHQRMQAEEEKGTLPWVLQPEQQMRGVDAMDPAWLQRQRDFLEKEFRLSALQKQKDAKLRAISLVCVQARNRFSRQRIRMDFSSGLEELKRKTDDDDDDGGECDDGGDEDTGDGDFATSDPGDLGDAKSQQKLPVFTVSSTEYLKLCGKLLRDGPPQVFYDPKDTEIPALKSFAIETGLKNSMKATEKVIRDVARVVSQIVNYLTNQRAEDISHQAHIQEIVQRALQDVSRLLQEATDDVLPDIQYCFNVLIQANLSRGSKKAKEQCEDIVKSWGMPEGFPHATYRAVCFRHGVYTSPKYGCVDFNALLAKPIYEAITAAWSEVFSSRLKGSFEHFTEAVLEKLNFFFQDLKRKLGEQSSLAEGLHALHWQQMEAVQARLCNFLLDQGDYVSGRQRILSRILTPEIQAGLSPAYAACCQMSGPGYFQRMKDGMENYIRYNKDSIFDSATAKLQRKLHLLQQDIGGRFQRLVRELSVSLRMQFEPLLKPVQRNAGVIPELMNICAKVDKICKRSCVEYVLPNITQVEANSPGTETPCFSALGRDIRLGAGPLPEVPAIQEPAHDAEERWDVPRVAFPAPPHLPQVVSVVQQQPQLARVSLQLYGKKRAREALLHLLEKRLKSQATAHKAGPDQTGQPLPSWSLEGQTVPCGPSTASGSLPASRAGAPQDCRQKAGWPVGAAQYSRPAAELIASPGSTGAPIQARDGIWGQCCDPNAKGETAKTPKTRPPGSSQEAPPSESAWLSH